MDQPTQQFPPRRRPRTALVLTGVFAALLVAGVVATALVTGDRQGDSAAAGSDESLDLLFAPAGLGSAESPDAVGAGEQAEPAQDTDKRGRHWRRGMARLKPGEKVVIGAVKSVGEGNLVVRKDDGAEVTVPTDADTKVRGNNNRALTDLEAGERVIVKAGADGTADGVLAVRAHAGGTVTKLEGDRATVVGPGGMTKELDLSGVTERPAVGTVVVAVGTVAEDGALKVEQLRELPTIG